MKILIMGLPGSGKTTLAKELINLIKERNKSVLWLNADLVRKSFNDWDFSYDGRIRQATRMKTLANESICDFVVCDFVAPLQEMREIFEPDVLIFVDTISEGRFDDTNNIFVPPIKFDFHVITKEANKWASNIIDHII